MILQMAGKYLYVQIQVIVLFCFGQGVLAKLFRIEFWGRVWKSQSGPQMWLFSSMQDAAPVECGFHVHRVHGGIDKQTKRLGVHGLSHTPLTLHLVRRRGGAPNWAPETKLMLWNLRHRNSWTYFKRERACGPTLELTLNPQKFSAASYHALFLFCKWKVKVLSFACHHIMPKQIAKISPDFEEYVGKDLTWKKKNNQ